MPAPALAYPLERRFVAHWLVAGPEVIRVTDVSPFRGSDDEATKARILHHFNRRECEVSEPPREGENLAFDRLLLPWRYYRTDDDAVVTSSQGGGCVYLRTWAYARIDAPRAARGEFNIAVHGPVDVWINGSHVLREERQSIFVPVRHRFAGELKEGANDVLVRFEAVKIRVGAYGMSLQLPAEAHDATVALPTVYPEVEARQAAEEAATLASLDRERYAEDDTIVLRWPPRVPRSAELSVEVLDGAHRIRVSRKVTPCGGGEVAVAKARDLGPGGFTIELTPTLVRDERVRALCRASLALRVGHSDYSEAPYTAFESRRQEALEHAARGSGLYSEIAKMELNRFQAIDDAPIQAAIEKIRRRNDTSDFELVGLLGAVARYGRDPAFPPQLKKEIEQCALGFRYWHDEPGNDVMWFFSENHQIAFHAAEVLAGQLWPDRAFGNANQTGSWHRRKGEQLSLDWLQRRATQGFHEWDSNTYFAVDLLALSHLADLAENDDLRALSQAVLSKMLFTIAANSYRGVFGSAHARTYPGDVKSGRSEGTSGAARLMWGLGAFTDQKCYVSLAVMRRYRMPPVIAAVALDERAETWSRERHGGTLDPLLDYFGGPWEVNKVTYRTPHHMLCSAQSFRPGARGNMQHIWQATLGPDAVVFVTHPPFLAESGSPNFWVGNVVLPRVAQWKDVLIDLRCADPDAGMGFTHAYVPLFAFDEHRMEGDWVLARKGEGYLALTSREGLRWTETGRYARREVRSFGSENVWICHLGSSAQDRDFATFCRNVGGMAVHYADSGVKLRSLRGSEIEFTWTGPLLVDGREVPLAGYDHYDTPFCRTPWPSAGMLIRCAGEETELNWGDSEPRMRATE
ncbi:MAG: hypothetical protein ACOY3P_20490 [Planctomycetota bacterium]